MASFTHRAFVSAPIETVFDVLADHRSYSAITPLRYSRLEREGDPAPNGVGAVRVLGLLGPPIREEIVEYVPPTRLVYRMLSGAPVRNYLGTVDLASDGPGTRVVWVTSLEPTLPGPLQPPAIAVNRLVIAQLLKAIKKRSEELARTRR